MQSCHIHIQSFNKKGWGIGPSENALVEVIGALPSERVGVELGRKRKGKFRGDLKLIITPSAMRVVPRCAHSPLCGGCVWQQMDYEAQLRFKKERLRKIFIEKQGALRPIIRCEKPWEYRNKMEFSFSQNKAGEKFLGLVIAGSRGHVLNLQECHLVSSWFIKVLSAIRSWWEKSALDAYKINDSGTLRTLIMREGKRTGDKLIMLTVSGNPAFSIKKREIQNFIEAVIGVIGEERVSIFLRVQQVCKGLPTQFFEMHLRGPPHLTEKCIVGGKEFTFTISPSSFFQPNTEQAEKLYEETLRLICDRKEHIMDLYAGIGTLGIICSERASQVTSIELNPYAVYDAEINQQLNSISHCAMMRGDVGKTLNSLIGKEEFVMPDLVIVDPPRSGLDASALKHIKNLNPKEVIYISCNPVTQHSNIQELEKAGYTLSVLQPVDQFPHTIHLETIALLVRR